MERLRIETQSTYATAIQNEIESQQISMRGFVRTPFTHLMY